MKIAIVAPSPVPFTLGGAESFYSGLAGAINDLTPHDAETIKLPSREHNLPDLVDTYRAFSLLDLSHFDLVVTSKYPAWMIDHPNHVLYLLHVLRGLYDHYWMMGRPEHIDFDAPDLRSLQVFMRRGGGRDRLREFFDRFAELVGQRGKNDPALAFPGPLARQIVHFLDRIGLSRQHVRRHLAISHTVASRSGYFPPGTVVDVVYPPSGLEGYHCRRFDYLFTASRLDRPKRIDLLIEAMRHVSSRICLKIAGTGPDTEHLRGLAAGDPRIEFLGYVSSRELVELYADALAVPFVPLEEDLGLITLEAMRSGKPVVTCHDSGGPTELVVNGLNGFVTSASPAAVGAVLSRLAESPALARRLGAAARKSAEAVTWRRVVNALLGAPTSRPIPHARRSCPKLVVTSTFPIHPPTSGGQLRCFHLCRALAEQFDVKIVSLTACGERPRTGIIAPGLTEMAVPKSLEHELHEVAVTNRVHLPITDVLTSGLIFRTPAYLDALADALTGSTAVILAHPFLYPAVRRLRPDLPIFYDAHNAEFLLKSAVLPRTPVGRDLLAATREVEAAATRAARLIFTCSAEDAEALRSTFSPASRFLVVPNGIDASEVPFTELARRSERAERWRHHFLAGHPPVGDVRHTAIFVASWHPPNNEAAEQIVALATELPRVLFLLVGSHCHYFASRGMPPNVVLMGILSNAVKNSLLQSADIALNPMLSGSGTNLKIVEYFAAGVPVVSTPVGVRGVAVETGAHLIVVPIDNFASAVREMLADRAAAARMALAARRLVEERYDWNLLGHTLLTGVLDALALPTGASTPASGSAHH